jgi:hypothetical protein
MVKPMKSQIQISNDQNTKQVWSAAGGLVIVICLIFVIWNFILSVLHNNSQYFLGNPSYKDYIVHIYYLAAREKPLFYPEEESNPYAFIL